MLFASEQQFILANTVHNRQVCCARTRTTLLTWASILSGCVSRLWYAGQDGGEKPWTRKTEILEYRTFYGVLQAMARELRRRGVTHVVMEASGVCTEPVYYALCEQDFTEVAVINPAHAKALKGHKTDARDCARLAELFECGLLHGSYIPAPELKEVRDLTRYRMKTVQARTSEIQRLRQGAGVGRHQARLGGQRHYRGVGHGDDRGADRRGAPRRRAGGPGQGRMRAAGKQADLSMALAGRFTEHHALLCRLHRDQISWLRQRGRRAGWADRGQAARWPREAGLLTSVPGFGDVVAQAWLGEIGPAPHRHFASHEKLACWVTLCPGNNISARKRKSGRTGDAGDLHQADADPGRLGRDPGPRPAAGPVPPPGPPVRRGQEPGREEEGDHRDRAYPAQDRLPGPQDRQPYTDLGADFYTRRESPEQQQAYLERQLQKLHPGCTITITISPPRGPRQAPPRRPPDPIRCTCPQTPGAAADPAPRPYPPDNQPRTPALATAPGQGPLPRAHRGPSFRVSPRYRSPGAVPA